MHISLFIFLQTVYSYIQLFELQVCSLKSVSHSTWLRDACFQHSALLDSTAYKTWLCLVVACLATSEIFCKAYKAFIHIILRNLVTFTESDSARSRLRSSTTRSAVTVRTRTKSGSRAFSVSGPTVWNSSLPSELRLVDCRSTFRRRLKSRYFQLAFN